MPDLRQSPFLVAFAALLSAACSSSTSETATPTGSAGTSTLGVSGSGTGGTANGNSGSSNAGATNTAGAGGAAVVGAAGVSAGGNAGLGGAAIGGAAGAGAQAGAGGAAPRSFVLPAYTSDAAVVSTNLGTRNAGHEFSVTAATVRVTDLGIWDNNADGLAAAHAVTLFSIDKFGAGAKATPIAGGSVVVPAGTKGELDCGFRYAPLTTPIELAPGKYAVVAYGLDMDDLPGTGGGLPLPATGVTDAQFDPYEFVSAASPAFPNGGDGNSHANASFRGESKVKPLRIMPLGASITDGYEGTMAGYRGPLRTLLEAGGVVFQYVGSSVDNPGTMPLPREQQHHEGHSGYVIAAGTSGRAGIYDSREAWLGPSGSQADLFLIIIGTNDVDLNYQLDTAGDRLDALVTSILDSKLGLQPKARLILAQLPPINDATEDARCVTYNAAVRAVVAAHRAKGEAISTVDLHSAITLQDKADNLHPNDVGYGKIAQVWYDAIRALNITP